MLERDIICLVKQAERRGIEKGIILMEQKILSAYENGTPIAIDGRAYFIKSDMDNLRDIFTDLEEDTGI